jgi:2-haloalkanoic acid dehalogenase type II
MRRTQLTSRAVALRAILFDLFDTLVDLHMDRLPAVEIAGRRFPSTLGALHRTASAWTDASLEQFAAGLRASDARLHEQHWAVGRELPTLLRFEVFCRGFGIAAAEAPELLTRTHMDGLRAQMRALPHHARVLERLRARYALGLVSNFSHSPTALGALREAGLESQLDAIAISDQVGIRKPRPEIFEHALAQLGLEPGEVVHVGDDLVADVDGAAELGMRSVWITRRRPEADALLAAHPGARPTHRIADLAELPDWLEAQPWARSPETPRIG